jgi:hypothetical protein
MLGEEITKNIREILNLKKICIIDVYHIKKIYDDVTIAQEFRQQFTIHFKKKLAFQPVQVLAKAFFKTL